MAPPPLHVLIEAEKNDLLPSQNEMTERLAARVTELEALAGKPRKTLKNSHIPPSKDDFGKDGFGKDGFGTTAEVVYPRVITAPRTKAVIARWPRRRTRPNA
jgi:hypothetical protein